MLGHRRIDGRFSPVEEISDTLVRNIGEVSVPSEQVERKSERAKTRFLSFKLTSPPKDDLEEDRSATEAAEHRLQLGRLVIVEGAGRGESFPILTSFTRIGRGDNQEVQLAFGDGSVSRESHATIFHYGERDGFVIRDGQKANPVLLNGCRLRGDQRLVNGDLICVGETTLRFFEPSRR